MVTLLYYKTGYTSDILKCPKAVDDTVFTNWSANVGKSDEINTTIGDNQSEVRITGVTFVQFMKYHKNTRTIIDEMNDCH